MSPRERSLKRGAEWSMWRADGHEYCFDAYRRAAFFPRDGDVSQERYDARRFHLPGLAGQGRSLAEIRSKIVHGRLCEDGAGIRRGGTGWHRVAIVAENFHRLRMGHRGRL